MKTLKAIVYSLLLKLDRWAIRRNLKQTKHELELGIIQARTSMFEIQILRNEIAMKNIDRTLTPDETKAFATLDKTLQNLYNALEEGIRRATALIPVVEGRLKTIDQLAQLA